MRRRGTKSERHNRVDLMADDFRIGLEMKSQMENACFDISSVLYDVTGVILRLCCHIQRIGSETS